MLLKDEQDETAITDAEKSVSGGLPLTFYIRSARLCLKKASLARISGEDSCEELQHLRRFEALVACALPVHKEYSDRRGDKSVRELHVGLVEARRRIQELLETGEGAISPASLKKSASPKKTSPPKKASPPKRAVSRIRPQAERKVFSSKLPPPAKSPVPLRRIRTTPKRTDSPRRNRSPLRNLRSGLPKQISITNAAGSSPRKRAQNASPKSSPTKGKRLQRSDDESAFYFSKKAPVHRTRRLKETDSRFETPSRGRNSARSLPTGMLRDLRSQQHEGIDSLDFRKSLDDLPSFDDIQEVCTARTDSGSVLPRGIRKSAAAKPIIGTSKVEKVWNNMVYEKTRASPSLSAGPNRFDASEVRVEVRRELKKSLDGFRNRIEEEGKKWRGRVTAVEKEVESVRDDSEGHLAVVRKALQEDAKRRDSSFKKLEGGILTDIEILRMEVAKKADRTWMENAISDAVEKCLVQMSEEKEKPVQEELRLLRSEVESLNKKRGELQGHLEELFQIMENERESISTEQVNLKDENGYIKKQLQSVKKDELQALIEMDEFKKGCDADMEDLKNAVGKLKDETAEIKHDVQELGETVRSERSTSRRSSKEGTSSGAEKMMIMDRVENLSKLYLGGLDEVRMDILDIKNKCQDKLEELEDQLRDFKQRHEPLPSRPSSTRTLSFDDLESRVHHLESKQELLDMDDVRSTISNVDAKYRNRVEKIEIQLRDLKHRSEGTSLESRISELEHNQESLQSSKLSLEDAVSAAEKERHAAATAASEASGAASKATGSLKEIVKCLEQERKRKTRQESIQDDTSRGSCDASRETDVTLASAYEAKKKADDLQEELKGVVSQVERQREAAAQAAAKASSFATESEDLLAEMAVMRRKVQLETDAETAPRTGATKHMSELEKRLDALEKKQSRPLSRVKSLSSSKKKQGEEEDGSKPDTRLGNLENHLEHVASATYTNLRILDKKVEHVSVSAQTALEGASIAEKKCGALGAELVKVFRVLASFKKEEDRSKDSSSPGRRPHFACDSCKKVVTILNKSLDSLPSENNSTSTAKKDVKRISVRLETEKSGRVQEVSEMEDTGTSPVKFTGHVRRSWEIAQNIAEIGGRSALEDLEAWSIR